MKTPEETSDQEDRLQASICIHKIWAQCALYSLLAFAFAAAVWAVGRDVSGRPGAPVQLRMSISDPSGQVRDFTNLATVCTPTQAGSILNFHHNGSVISVTLEQIKK